MRTFVTGIGIVSPAGNGLRENIDAVKNNISGIDLPEYFMPAGDRLPVGEVKADTENSLPRTHSLALTAAREAVAGFTGTIDGVIMGVTTGGMPQSEKLLRDKRDKGELFSLHSNGSVAETVARYVKCKGPVITISTACSSGTVALIIARELIRSGQATNILAGGADGLCMLTYYGFNSLQLIDPEGARPFDRNRLGMTVAEGAALLLLSGKSEYYEGSFAEITGGGLSCDAYHPTAPHPEGDGAFDAMRKAVEDSQITPSDIEYINLHGTGTADNDRSEAKAVQRLFGDSPPPLSSLKGAFGHSLGASGAIEAAVTSFALSGGIIPGNFGFHEKDPELNLVPQTGPEEKSIRTAISNSFGFGGNNASLVLSSADVKKRAGKPGNKVFLTISGAACITGAGNTGMTMGNLYENKTCFGAVPVTEISKNIPKRFLRRLKRTALLSLSASLAAHENSGLDLNPSSIYYGTGWGALSETSDFLDELFSTGEKFASPTNFINSVHNAAAGHLAILFQSRGNNLTATGVNYSFEQALFTAELLSREDENPILVAGADEYHEKLSPLFDQSVRMNDTGSDGAGALIITPSPVQRGITVSVSALFSGDENENTADKLLSCINVTDYNEECAVIFAGIPGVTRKKSEQQLEELIKKTAYAGPVFDYRKYLGEHSSVSATASVVAYNLLLKKELPVLISGDGSKKKFRENKILLLGFGEIITAIEMVLT